MAIWISFFNSVHKPSNVKFVWAYSQRRFIYVIITQVVYRVIIRHSKKLQQYKYQENLRYLYFSLCNVKISNLYEQIEKHARSS